MCIFFIFLLGTVIAVALSEISSIACVACLIATFFVTVLVMYIPWRGLDKPYCNREFYLMNPKQNTSENRNYYIEIRGNKLCYAYSDDEMCRPSNVMYGELRIKDNVKIYQSAKCESPIMKEYVISSKTNFVTIGGFPLRTEYVFYVPEGTVLESSNIINRRVA